MSSEQELALKRKHQRITEIGQLIDLIPKEKLTKEQRQKIQTLHDRMDFRCLELLDEMQLREADIKIEMMQEVFDFIKTPSK